MVGVGIGVSIEFGVQVLRALWMTYCKIFVGSDDGEDLVVSVGDCVEDLVRAREIWCLTGCWDCDILS